MSCVSHPAALPDLFLDRSLGGIKVPALLREAGLRLVTLSEHYGKPADEEVADTAWLELAGETGDTRIRYNPAEREAVYEHKVRCFCLSSQNLSGAAMAARFLDNLTAITNACAEAGPFIYAVHQNRIERLAIRES